MDPLKTNSKSSPEATLSKNEKGPKRTWPFVLLLILLGIGVRYELYHDVPPFLFLDSPSYIQPAKRFLEGGSIASLLRPPVYPLFLSSIYLFFGTENHDAVVMFQHLIGLLANIIYFYLFLKIISNRWIAFFSTSLVAINYKILAFECYVLSETLCHFFLAIYCLLLIHHISNPYSEHRRSYWFVLQVCTIQALLILTKPFFILLPVAVGCFLSLRWNFQGFKGIKKWRCLVVFSVLSLLPILGWKTINHFTYGQFTFSSVKDINLFGKIIQTKMYESAPVRYEAITRVIQENHPDKNPYNIAPQLQGVGDFENNSGVLVGYSHACIKNAPFRFFLANLKLLPWTLSSQYEPIKNSPSKSMKRPLSRIIDRINRFSSSPTTIRSVYFLLAAMIFIFSGPWRVRIPAFFWWQSSLLGAMFGYSLIISTIGSYDSYGRLMILVEPLRQFFHLIFFPYLIYSYFSYRLGKNFKNFPKNFKNFLRLSKSTV